jgi:hypothetical protein
MASNPNSLGSPLASDQSKSLSFGNLGVKQTSASSETVVTSDGFVANLNTLDEPIKTTIMRDLRAIGEKLRYVLLPGSRHDHMRGLRDWDLWGPFLLCMILSVLLSFQAGSIGANSVNGGDSQSGYVFAMVFVLVWVGSAIVTVNAVLLKGRVSFFQSVCVLGYCIAPLVMAALLSAFFNAFKAHLMKLIVVMIGFIWSTSASVGFIGELVPEDRRALGVYPVGLFYFTLAWVILGA